MSSIPWDDWFYHLSDRRDEINTLHQNAVNLANQTQTDILALNAHLDTYRSLLAGNVALLAIRPLTVMDDLKLADYAVQVDALPPPPAGVVPIEMAQLITEALGGGFALKLMWNAGKQVYRNLFANAGEQGESDVVELGAEDLAEGLADAGVSEGSVTTLEGATRYGGESVAEDAVDTVENVGEDVSEAGAKAIFGDMTAASVAATGIGVFAAVGIDAVFGAIDGAKEKSELDDAVTKMQACVAKAQDFAAQVQSRTEQVKSGVVAEQNRVLKLVQSLAAIKAPTFAYDLQPGWDNTAQFLSLQQSAIEEYSVFVDLRNYYCKVKTRNPAAGKDDIINAYLFAAPPEVTADTVDAYWTVLAQNSDAVRTLAPCPAASTNSGQ